MKRNYKVGEAMMTKEDKDELGMWRLNDTKRIKRCVDLVEPELELAAFYYKCSKYCLVDGDEVGKRLFFKRYAELHGLLKSTSCYVDLNIP